MPPHFSCIKYFSTRLLFNLTMWQFLSTYHFNTKLGHTCRLYTQNFLKWRPVSQFILPPGQLAPREASQPWLAYPLGGKLSRDILPPALVILTPGGASCPGRFILPPAHIKKILLCDVYYYLQHYNNYMQFLSYNYVNLRCSLQTFSWVSYWQGVGGKLSREVYLAPRPEFQREWIISNFYYIIYFRNI